MKIELELKSEALNSADHPSPKGAKKSPSWRRQSDLATWLSQCQFFTWLCAILLNRHRNAVRQKRPLPFSSLGLHDQKEFRSSLDRLADHDCLPNQAAQLREQATLVLECIRSLPLIHQQVVYLRFYVDDSFEGIAEALGCSVGTVKSRLFRALDKLRAMNAINAQGANL